MALTSLAQAPLVACVLTVSTFGQGFGPEIPSVDPLARFSTSVIADFDGDGDLDVVAGGEGGVSAVFLENTGSGEFLPQRRLGPDPIAAQKREVEAADVDGDGDLDVLFLGSVPETVGWIENVGGAQFRVPEVVASAGPILRNLRAVDVNGDGSVDILATDQGSVVWFPNTGTGDFGSREVLAQTSNLSLTIDYADVDQDGDGDIVVADFAQSRIRWSEQTATGVYGPLTTLTANITRPSSPRVVDLDGDGVLDVVADNESTDRVEWVRGLGGLTFGPSTRIVDPFIGVVDRYELVDLTGNGLLDVVALGADDDEFEFLLNQGGTFDFFSTAFGSEDGTRDFSFGDLDGDGDADFLATEDQRLQAYGWETGGFDAGRELSFTVVRPSVIRSPDLDGDGLADLVVSTAAAGDVYSFFRNGGDGSWSVPAQQFNLINVTQIETVDMDGDGDLDIVASGGSFDAILAAVHWVENLGGGALASPVTLYSNLADGPATFQLGDLEGDGDLDVLWCHRAAFSFSIRSCGWSVQSAPGVFVPGPTLANNALPPTHRLGRIDGDGIVDMFNIHTQLGVAGLTWSAGDGSGGFGPEVVIRDPSMPAIVGAEVADIDGDGNVDVVAYGSDGVDLHLWQPATSSFGGPLQVEPASVPNPIALLRDVNQDGLVDVFVSASTVPARWYENLGSGAFASGQQLLEEAPGSIALAVGDYDGDTDLDVLKVTSSGSVSWNTNLARFGSGYCGPAAPNSSGESAAIWASGTPSVAINDFTLVADRLPPQTFGFFLVSPMEGFVAGVAGSPGNLCLGGPIGRLNRSAEIFLSSATGRADLLLDLTNVPTPTAIVAMEPGDTRYFQAWFRDVAPTATSNLTNGLRVEFE